MELKKSDKANLEKKRGLFLEIGLLVSLCIIFLGFEMKSAPRTESTLEQVIQAPVEEEIVPITRQDDLPPPPPAPPQISDILDIVSDDVQVDSDIIIDVEASETMEIDIIEFEESVIEEVDEEEVFSIVEDMPLFNGKLAEEGFRDYVQRNTNYPAVAQENGISGRVFIEFTINRQGELVDAKVIRPVDPSLDAEALRVIRSSPKWTPGKQRGQTVKVKYTFPVVFRLNN